MSQASDGCISGKSAVPCVGPNTTGRIDAWRQSTPAFFGIWAVHTWVLWTFLHFDSSSDVLWWFDPYLVLTLALVAFVVLGATTRLFRLRGRTGVSLRADVVVACVMCFAGILAALLGGALGMRVVGTSGTVLRVVGVTCAGLATAWSYVRWGLFYARIDTKSAVFCLLMAFALGSAAKALLTLLPDAIACVLVATLPFVSLWCVRAALGKTEGLPARPTPLFSTARDYLGLWPILLCLAVYSVVCTSVGGIVALPAAAGSVSWFSAVSHLIEVILAVSFILLVFKGNWSFGFTQLWCIIFFAAAIALLWMGFPSPEEPYIVVELMRLAVNLIVMYYWMALADIAHHSSADPQWVFAVGWAVYTLFRYLGKCLVMSGAAQSALLMPQGIHVALFALSAVLVVCLAGRSGTVLRIFSDLDDSEPNPEEYSRIDGRCSELARLYGLTDREVEVMRLLCRGRSKSYIAETLSIAENTVGSHTKHLYAKMDVHSRNELMDLIG